MHAEGLLNAPGCGVPPMPELVGDLLAVRDEMPSRRILRLFNEEPELTEVLLAMAAAPYYSGRRPLTSLSRVIERVGLGGFQGLGLRAALNALVYQASDHPLLDVLLRHASGTAYITSVLARYTPLPAARLFTAALVQDVGIAIPLLRPLPLGSHEADIWQAIRYAHEGIARIAAEQWDMPAEVVRLVGHHHQLGRGLAADREVAALTVADYVAWNIGVGIEHPVHPEPHEESVEYALEILELDRQQLPAIHDESHELLSLLA